VNLVPVRGDAEIAAATFDRHLAAFFAKGRPAREQGWERVDIDPLHSVVRVPAIREGHADEAYLILVGAEYYDLWPPSVTFVEPLVDGTYREAPPNSQWWPRIAGSPGFAIAVHPQYRYPNGEERQLICFSHSLDYYSSNHTPAPAQRWTQGRHTVSSTLSRISDVLKPPSYQGPSGADHP